ncbi:MAG TPA: histidine kinase dimerization/phosphoacceptor domain -containing protein [Devosia sp.]|nr:histidine kinase dimerization/phosphoacceptor domain -containing protein [Devosia sp.]
MSTASPEIGSAPAAGRSPGWLPFAGRRWEAADGVIVAAVLLVVGIFAFFTLLCVQGYQQTLESARVRAQTTAEIVGTQVDWLLGSGFTALALIDAKLAFEPAVLDPVDRADLDSALETLPSGASFALYDPTGAVLENGGSPALPANIANETYYSELISGTDVQVVAPQQFDDTTGTPIILLARRLGTDVLAGVAVLALPAIAMESFWSVLKLPEGSTISIIRDDGWIIARHPPLEQAMNMSETSPYWAQVESGDAGTYDSGRSPADGIARIVGYQRLPAYGALAFGSVSQDSAVASLWTAIITVLWLLVPFALALLGFSFWTAHLLRRSGRTQRTLAAAVAHNEVLFREIHHRVKNNLQSVASLLQMQPIPREIKTNMGQRIAAMSAVHEHIYRSSSFETVHVREYLQTLVANIKAGHDPSVHVVEDIADLPVDREAATPLGLILNEVVSNAFKHAFADGREGALTVRLVRTGDGRGQLTVEDNGLGFDPQTPTKGIGRRLISALTQQIGGESRFETAVGGGSLFTLTFPLASQETRPSASSLP